MYIKISQQKYVVKSSLLLLCVRGGLIDHNISVTLALFPYHFSRAFGCICGSDRVVSDSPIVKSCNVKPPVADPSCNVKTAATESYPR